MDVCYVRTSRRRRRSADLVAEHLAALASCGVTWLEFNVARRDPAEWIECVETCFPASDQARYISGQMIDVDGGYSV
jgi:hypothetical protein